MTNAECEPEDDSDDSEIVNECLATIEDIGGDLDSMSRRILDGKWKDADHFLRSILTQLKWLDGQIAAVMPD